jgi:hypothetical protein
LGRGGWLAPGTFPTAKRRMRDNLPERRDVFDPVVDSCYGDSLRQQAGKNPRDAVGGRKKGEGGDELEFFACAYGIVTSALAGRVAQRAVAFVGCARRSAIVVTSTTSPLLLRPLSLPFLIRKGPVARFSPPRPASTPVHARPVFSFLSIRSDPSHDDLDARRRSTQRSF